MERTSISIGFTGSREGMSESQKIQVKQLLSDCIGDKHAVVHHGDCVGADADFHEICVSLVATANCTIKIVVHPPVDSKAQAFCKGDEARVPKPYLDRNRDIVDESAVVIACPLTGIEQHRSGTWYTIRYAEKKNKEMHVIL